MKFRKKPIIIEAFQVLGKVDGRYKYHPEWPQWAEDAWNMAPGESGAIFYDPQSDAILNIRTLEGSMSVSVGDWIIKGVKGEIYPCKPDIFEATYQEIHGS